MGQPSALITGITGQDGSYLCELLLERGYTVHGTLRRSSTIERPRLDHLTSNPDIYDRRLFLHYADLSDVAAMRRLLLDVDPREMYHLAGQSHVGLSFEVPESTCEFTAMGTLRLLELLRDLGKPVRFLNMASSEIFGRTEHTPQNEETPPRPSSPYGVAKAFTREMVRVYRESFGMFACNAICYNHESPRRGASFVTRKIALGVAAIARGEQQTISLGNLDVERDWGYAPEYVEGMWRVLQREHADDFVLATGRACSLVAYLDAAFRTVGLDWRNHVRTDPRFVRPAEPTRLVGDPSKAKAELDWKATVVGEHLAALMVEAELDGKHGGGMAPNLPSVITT